MTMRLETSQCSDYRIHLFHGGLSFMYFTSQCQFVKLKTVVRVRVYGNDIHVISIRES